MVAYRALLKSEYFYNTEHISLGLSDKPQGDKTPKFQLEPGPEVHLTSLKIGSYFAQEQNHAESLSLATASVMVALHQRGPPQQVGDSVRHCRFKRAPQHFIQAQPLTITEHLNGLLLLQMEKSLFLMIHDYGSASYVSACRRRLMKFALLDHKSA